MKVKYVKEINWSGGPLSTYAILEDGPLTEQSIVPAPTLFLIHLAQEGQLPNSIRSCAHDLRSFFEALEAHDQDWKLLTNADMSGYLYGHLKVARSCSDKSIRRHISTLKLFYAHAWGLGMLDAPASFSYHFIPDEQKKQGDGKKRVNFDLYNKYVEKDIFERLLGSIKTQSAFEKERDELVLHMGYYCGLRSAEVTDSRNLLTSDLRARIAQAEKADEQTITVPIIGKGRSFDKLISRPKPLKKSNTFWKEDGARLSTGP